MNLRGRLNGLTNLQLPSGFVEVSQVADETDSSAAELTVQWQASDGRTWQRRIANLGPDPRGEHSDSRTRDFSASFWPQADALIIAGESKAVFLDARTGEIRLEVPLEFTGQSSLEVLAFLHDPRSVLFFVASTRLVAAIRKELQVAWTWKPKGVLRSAKIRFSGGLTVEYYDATCPGLPSTNASLDANGHAFTEAGS